MSTPTQRYSPTPIGPKQCKQERNSLVRKRKETIHSCLLDKESSTVLALAINICYLSWWRGDERGHSFSQQNTSTNDHDVGVNENRPGTSVGDNQPPTTVAQKTQDQQENDSKEANQVKWPPRKDSTMIFVPDRALFRRISTRSTAPVVALYSRTASERIEYRLIRFFYG